MLFEPPDGRTAMHFRRALSERMSTLPEQLRRTLTWDQGKETGGHIQFTVDTGISDYFCDPRSPWQRGASENTYGLLRQHLPRKTNLPERSQLELDPIARELNGQPRQTYNWKKPSEVLSGLMR